MMDWLYIGGGLVALAVGGDVLVRGAVGAASRLGVSPLLIGLVLVGFGTSLPELTTSVQAALLGSPGIAVGNVVGSNIANVLLILGFAALVAPIAVAPAALRRDGSAMMLAMLAASAALWLTPLGALSGGLLVAGLVVYILFSYWLDRRGQDAAASLHLTEAETAPRPKNLLLSLLLFAVGLCAVVFGARFLVEGAIGIATGFGISDAVIGLTIVAVGTSLPELAASTAAALRKQGDIAIGNIIGSNIFNALGILGVTGLVRSIDAPPSILGFDLWVMLGAGLLLLATAFTGRSIKRGEGVFLLALYAAYVVWLGFNAAA